MLDRNILCNCDIEAESNFKLESLAPCGEHEKPDLEMYFTVNVVIVDYLEELNETIRTPINRNWTSFKQLLPVSLETFQLSSKLMQVPVMLKDFIDQYQENRITTTKWESPTSKFRSFINCFIIDMLVVIAAILRVFICNKLHHHRTVQIKGVSSSYGLTESKSCRCPQYQQTNSKLQSRVTKNLNNPKSGNSGGAPSKENQKECVLPGTTLFKHGKGKIISGRYKIPCFIRSKQNS